INPLAPVTMICCISRMYLLIGILYSKRMLSELNSLDCHTPSKIDAFLQNANGGRPIVLYGAGFAMPAILRKLERYGFDIAGICDANPSLQGTCYGSYRIYAPEDAWQRFC